MPKLEQRRNVERTGEVISFAERAEQAHQRAEHALNSDRLSEVLPGAMQVLAFEQEETEADPAVEKRWVEKLQERLVAA